MARRTALICFGFLTAVGAVFTARAAAPDDHGFIVLDPSEVRFKSALGVGPEQAVIFGDPSKPGLYVIRVRFPPPAPIRTRISIRRIATPRSSRAYGGTEPAKSLISTRRSR